MAFILSPGLPSYTSAQNVARCALAQPRSHSTSPIQLSTAALLLSTTLLTTTPALAAENPLVFDHDQTLVNADFSHRSDLRGAIFSKANCKGANFEGSDLTNAQLDDINVRLITLSNQYRPFFTRGYTFSQATDNTLC